MLHATPLIGYECKFSTDAAQALLLRRHNMCPGSPAPGLLRSVLVSGWPATGGERCETSSCSLRRSLLGCRTSSWRAEPLFLPSWWPGLYSFLSLRSLLSGSWQGGPAVGFVRDNVRRSWKGFTKPGRLRFASAPPNNTTHTGYADLRASGFAR
jgi:hypothetical protein